jgi:hypothetical protein
MEEAKRLFNHWLIRRKVFKCVPSKGTTHDYHLIEEYQDIPCVVAQVSFHPNGALARWAKCHIDYSLPHGKVHYWDPYGALTRVCEYVRGKRHGLDVYYKDGLMYYATTYRRGRKDGLAWDGDAVSLYRHGKAVIPAWSQDRLTYLASYDLYASLRQMLLVGAVDNGEALAIAAYEGHTLVMELLMRHQKYGAEEILEAWTQALRNGQKEATRLLRPHLSLDTDPMYHSLSTGQLAEASELLGWGFYPTERHLIDAAGRGDLEAVRWCLAYSPELRTHYAWNRALAAEHYEVARALEPGYMRVLRAVKDYFIR